MTDQWSRFESSVERYLEYMPVETFDYSLNISLQHNYLFVETPKVCCSTIKLNLQRLEVNIPDFVWPAQMDVHNRDFSPLLRPSQVLDFELLLATRRLFTFCFVRNPYTRLLSAYLDKIQGNRPPKLSILQALGLNTGNIDQDVSFDQFIHAIGKQSLRDMNPHWRPQYHQTLQGAIDYDFIGRYEDFTTDFQQVFSRLSRGALYDTVAETRHKTDANDQVSEYYTEELRNRVYQIYKIDFTHFDYGTSLLDVPVKISSAN